MKNTLVVLALAALFPYVPLPASCGNIRNDDDLVFSRPLVVSAGAFVPPVPSQRPERIYLSSVCATSSPSLSQSRANVMAGLSGLSVAMDRTINAAAWYLIPEHGWQLYDSVSVVPPLFFWDGQSFVTNTPGVGYDQHGHRIIASVIMREAVSKYWCRITSTSTNIPLAFFNVATNTANAETRFNQNYVAVNFGSNGVLESYPNPNTGQWFQVGDDSVYSNGELPSAVTYHYVCRFGATIVNLANDSSGFDGLKGEFASAPRSLKAELIRREGTNDTIVDTYAVDSGVPQLAIGRNGPSLAITVNSGQKMLLYRLVSASNVDAPLASWQLFYPDKFSLGQPIPVDVAAARHFFKVYSVTGMP